ncbi:MAG: SoxR reducing system RseC family protein [Bacteroidales bacterium]|nr:SoxR reducing system RseC family protein [Bacteroidales bacterium]
MIEHEVSILSVDPTRHTARVRLVSQSACAGCAARKVCAVQESQDKEWTVDYPTEEHYTAGEKAILVISEKNGFKAVLLAYILPFLCLTGLIFGLSRLTQDELLIGLTALGGVALYFIVLAFSKKRLSRTLRYGIRHAN